MDDAIRAQIIMAAVTSTPPVTEPLKNREGDIVATEQELWQEQVASRARSISVMVGARSPIGRQLEVMGAAGDPDNDSAKIIVGTILRINREESSTRGVVTMKTRVHEEFAPEGLEQVRTERTDTAAGLLMSLRVRNELIGHRVMAYVEMQQIPNTKKKTRVVIHFEDLGLDENFTAED